MSNTREQILASLQPLFEEAETKKLWFWQRHYDMWLSPGELRAAHSEGRFLWGQVNWELRSPFDLLENMRQEMNIYQKRFHELAERLKKEGYTP